MRYGNVVCGKFVARPNRFIAHVLIDEVLNIVHVKNTGRCCELLVPGCCVWLAEAANPARKTKYDLVAVEKNRCGMPPLLINMDSQIPNMVVEEFFRSGGVFSPSAIIRREVKYRNSRFDLYIEDAGRKIFCEVKGVTLENNGSTFFPDAPTERGVRHLRELAEAVADGYEAWVFFVIQMSGINSFAPNEAMHPRFGEALREAAAAGVEIMAKCCRVTPSSISILNTDDIPVLL